MGSKPTGAQRTLVVHTQPETGQSGHNVGQRDLSRIDPCLPIWVGGVWYREIIIGQSGTWNLEHGEEKYEHGNRHSRFRTSQVKFLMNQLM